MHHVSDSATWCYSNAVLRVLASIFEMAVWSVHAGGIQGVASTRKGCTVTQDTDRSQRLQDEGRWEQFKGKAREEWGDLTDQELEQARGNWEQFVGTVKEKTGETGEAIERKYKEWTS